MYKILIAEDNPLIRKGIVSIIHWDELNCSFCGEAGNGHDALKMIDTLSPDIVLTDIQMPLVNGLHILDYITEQSLPIETIIISGYDRFDYATHALRNNCVDYILKPIKEDELNHAIEKAVTRLSKRVNPQGAQNLHLLQHTLYEKVQNDASYTAADLYNELHAVQSVGLFCVACLTNKYARYQELADWIMTQSFFHKPVCLNGIRELVILFPCSDDSQYLHLCRFLENCSASLPSSLGSGLAIGISAPVKTDAAVQEPYSEAHHCLNFHALHPEQTVFRGQIYNTPMKATPLFADYEKDLLDYLVSGNANGAITLIQQSINNILNLKDVTPEGFILLLTQIYCILLKTQSSRCDEIQKEINAINRPDLLLGHMNVDFLTSKLYGFCTQIAAEAISMHNSHATLVQGIRNYMNDHFTEHITLKTMELLFHTNASYLSVLFKKESGVGFNQYLKELRLERAKVLMKETEYPLSEVCERCGFSNYIHFSKTFKEYTGLSPSEYRHAEQPHDSI